jgi:hypothetical protein
MKKLLKLSLILVIFSFLLLTRPAFANTGNADISVTTQILSSNEKYYEYRVTVTNNGPNPADRVIITNILPNGVNGFLTHLINPNPLVCNNFSGNNFNFCLAKLAVGNSVVLDYTINVEDPKRFIFVHEVKAESSTFDSIPSNNIRFFYVSLPSMHYSLPQIPSY